MTRILVCWTCGAESTTESETWLLYPCLACGGENACVGFILDSVPMVYLPQGAQQLLEENEMREKLDELYHKLRAKSAESEKA